MSTQRAVLGVDVGTSSSKGVLVDIVTGEVLAEHVVAHEPDRPIPGQVEMSMHVWWSDFVEIASALAPRANVVSVGVSGMGPCLGLADDAGPTRSAILYGVDQRAEQEIVELTAQLGAAAIYEATGSALSTQSVGPKILWVSRHERDVFERSSRWFMPASWIVWKLTGEYVLDYHSASQSSPLFDIETMNWHDEWARRIAGHLELPRLGWATEVAGVVTPRAAALTGLPSGTPVGFGSIDAWTEAASVGVTSPGRLMLMYGTTTFLIAQSALKRRSPRLWLTAGLDPSVYSVAGGMNSGGAAIAWARSVSPTMSFDELFESAGTSPPGARGVLTVPFFDGERTPVADPHATAATVGTGYLHTSADLLRSIVEGIAYGVRDNLMAIEAAGVPVDHVYAVGGGVRSDVWLQAVSDVTGKAQTIRRHAIGASLGNAMLAAGLVGVDADVDRWNPVEKHAEPREQYRRMYDELFELYRLTYEQTATVMHRLRHLR